jgi:hypothetical protein
MDGKIKAQAKLIKSKAIQIDLACQGTDKQAPLLVKLLNSELKFLSNQLDSLLAKEEENDSSDFDFEEFDLMLDAHKKS